MDFSIPSEDSVIHEFVGLVLAGFGAGLTPLTNDHRDEPSPKCLLPIANKPMLEYPLTWLDRSGITDVILICPATHKSAVSHYIHSAASTSSFSSLRIDLHTYDATQDASGGTCAVLRHIAPKIRKNFVLVPCDFLPPSDLPLIKILNKFRIESAHDGAIAVSCWYESVIQHNDTPDEWGVPDRAPAIVIDETTGTLLQVDTLDDQDRNAENIEIRMSLLQSYPRAKLTKKYEDSHVYVCKRSILDILQQKPHMDSFRQDFIPWLCKVQTQRSKRIKYAHSAMQGDAFPQTVALEHSSLQRSFGNILKDPPNSNQSSSDLDDTNQNRLVASLRVGVIIHYATQGLAVRINNLSTLLETNKKLLAEISVTSAPNSLIDSKAIVSSDSLIGTTTRVAERASIKRSVIGQHCTIGKMAKIQNSILMDHCIIEDGAKIDSCVLGKSTKVGEKASLLKCVSQSGFEISSGEVIKNERLDVTNWEAADGEEIGSENISAD